MDKKKILVLGASESCIGMIKAIKRMGHQVIVVGNTKESPGKQFADYYLTTDDNNVESVISFCKDIGVDGIVPVPVDRPLKWMANVAEHFGLIFLSPGAVENFRNKFKMKLCLQNANINCARGLMTTIEEFDESLIKYYNFPLVVKPIDAYASRGVIKADSYEELIKAIEEASSFSSNGQILIEEFIDGREFNAEGVCYKGNVEIYAIVEKIRDPFPRTIEMGHIIPPEISKEEENIIIDTISKSVKTLGMENGAFNAEIKLFNNQGHVIEVNGRLAGDFIISHLLKPVTGQDMEEAVVNISLGIKPDKAQRNYIIHGMVSFFNLEPGTIIKEVNDFSFVYKNPHVIWAYLFFKKGDVIPQVLHMGHRSGFVIVTSDTREEMFKLAETTKSAVINSIEFENQLTA